VYLISEVHRRHILCAGPNFLIQGLMGQSCQALRIIHMHLEDLLVRLPILRRRPSGIAPGLKNQKIYWREICEGVIESLR
jgi:hypothetical protein